MIYGLLTITLCAYLIGYLTGAGAQIKQHEKQQNQQRKHRLGKPQ